MINLNDIVSEKLMESLSSVSTTRDFDLESKIGKSITGIGVTVDSKVILENEVADVRLSYVFNEDDVTVERSSKMIYVYLNSNKLDYKVTEVNGEESSNTRLVPETSSLKFLARHPKAWFGDDQLYLLKINLTTNVVYLFDTVNDKFSRVNKDMVTYNDTSMKWLSEVLTPEYLQSYISNELSLLCTKSLIV